MTPGDCQPLGLVVSACRAADIDVWERAAPRIVRHIQADRYLVVVPEDDVALFRGKSPRNYDVEAETRYVGGLKAKIRAKLVGGPNERRTGWYLQQFVKLSAILSDAPDDRPALIWDADTIPLQVLNFANHAGVLSFVTGKEHHRPYFQLTARILGFGREQNFSFIAQCLPTWRHWVNDMCSEIELRSGRPWDDTIIDAIDPLEGSGFSEYETLGTFSFKRYPDAVSVSTTPWLRSGVSTFGLLSKLNEIQLDQIGRCYAYVAFESHDPPSWRRRLLSAARRALTGSQRVE